VNPLGFYGNIVRTSREQQKSNTLTSPKREKKKTWPFIGCKNFFCLPLFFAIGVWTCHCHRWGEIEIKFEVVSGLVASSIFLLGIVVSNQSGNHP
jgi:hypothetical protein